jgi:hypothetical protein
MLGSRRSQEASMWNSGTISWCQNSCVGEAAFQLAIGPAGEVYREAGKLAEQRHEEITKALKSELAKYQRSNGVMMDSSSWKVTARSPS